MTDLPQQGQQGRGAPPRGVTQPPRTGASAVAIVVALVVALLGFFILKKIDNNGTNAVGVTTGDGSVATTTAKSSIAGSPTTAVGTATVPTTPAPAPTIPRATFVVVIANSSGVTGAAKSTATALQPLGYKAVTAVNTSDNKKITTTEVYFAAGADAAAAQVISDLKLPGVTAAPFPADSAFRVLKANRVGASVVVLLGTDLANITTAKTVPPTIAPAPTVAHGVTTTTKKP